MCSEIKQMVFEYERERERREGENVENVFILSFLAIFNSYFDVWNWQKFGKM